MAKAMAFIQILRPRNVRLKWGVKMSAGIYCFQNLRIKVKHLSFVGLGKIQLDIVGLCWLHDQQVSAFQRVCAAFYMEGAGSVYKIKEFHPVMGVQHKTGLIRGGGQAMRKAEIFIDITIQSTHHSSPKPSICI